MTYTLVSGECGYCPGDASDKLISTQDISTHPDKQAAVDAWNAYMDRNPDADWVFLLIRRPDFDPETDIHPYLQIGYDFSGGKIRAIVPE